MKKKLFTPKQITFVASMIALSFILTFISIPYPFAPFLKLDFAIVPLAIVTIVVNKYAGITGLFIQFLLTFFRNPAGWIFNAAASFIFLVTLILVLSIISTKTKQKIFSILIALLIATIATTVGATLANYFFLVPLLTPKFALPFNETIALYGLFNFIKFTLATVVTLFVFPQIKKILT